VFILYAVPIGVALGYLIGGRLDRLGRLRFEWAWLAIVGLVVQIILFSPLLTAVADAVVGAAVYVASTAAVLVAVLRNIGVPGMPLVWLGAASNLAAVIANGGIMPTTNEALATAGLEPVTGLSNSAVIANPALGPLTDIFALPAWFPLANVFSIGDVLIGVGIVIVIALGMRNRVAPVTAPESA
jgi:Family of unknown function (DUF5317)